MNVSTAYLLLVLLFKTATSYLTRFYYYSQAFLIRHSSCQITSKKQHIALCSGVYQLISFYLSIQSYQIDYCEIIIIYNGSDEGMSHIHFKRRALSLGFTNIYTNFNSFLEERRKEVLLNDISFYYTRAVAASYPIAKVICTLLPSSIYLYYESYNTAVSLLVARKNLRLGLKAQSNSQWLIHVVIQKLITPNSYLVPIGESQIWKRYALDADLKSTLYFDDSERLSLLVNLCSTEAKEGSTILDRHLDCTVKPRKVFILLTSLFYERNEGISLNQELNLYNSIINNFNFSEIDMVCIKMHPKSSSEKKNALTALARNYTAFLLETESMVESFVMTSTSQVTLVSPPCTALVNLMSHPTVKIYCIDHSVLTHFLGLCYDSQQNRQKDTAEIHSLFHFLNIPQLSSVIDLSLHSLS